MRESLRENFEMEMRKSSYGSPCIMPTDISLILLDSCVTLEYFGVHKLF